MLQRNDVAIMLGLLVFRVANALFVKTFFQPDEYFQSLEPAWQSAFGDGSGAWITWEWQQHLRSSLHPLLFAGVYRAVTEACSFLELDAISRAELLLAAPKILQACFAVATDFFTFRLASSIYGRGAAAANAALFITVLSPWQAFCSVRTLSNSLETALTVAALYAWPWSWFLASAEQNDRISTKAQARVRQTTTPSERTTPQRELYIALAIAALACILRPTNTIIWVTVVLALLGRRESYNKLAASTLAAILSGGSILALSISADKFFYQEWVLPPLRFLQFNLVQSLAVFYGKNRPDYYFTEGLPLLLTTFVPFAAIGMWSALRPTSSDHRLGAAVQRRTRSVLALTVISSVLTLSLISHKEVRFIYPLLPILHVLAAEPLASFFIPFPRPAKTYRKALLLLTVSANIFVAWYTLFVHQRGVIDVMHYLRSQHERPDVALQATWAEGKARPSISASFLMPCHSTPWRSHFIYPEIEAWALTCDPPLNLTLEQRETYMDEADVFYADPAAWIRDNMQPSVQHEYLGDKGRRAWPDLLVFFECLEETLSKIPQSNDYVEAWRTFNTHWHDDSRRKGDVVVWRRKS